MNYLTKRYVGEFFVAIALTATSCSASAKMSGVVHDTYTLDVFKTNAISAEEIDTKYRKELELIASRMVVFNKMPDQRDSKALEVAFNSIMLGVKNSGDFAFVGMSPIAYPGNKRVGISIDVVEKKDISRLQGMLPNPTGSYSDPSGLLASWRKYEDYGWKNLFTKNPKITLKNCPAFHCMFGFNDPAIKHYAALFNDLVPKHKAELITILRDDKDEIKRADAAFLLAHLPTANEVIDALTPSMRDASSGVRNNVTRVLLETMAKAPDADFKVDEAVHALSYPTTSDRNKDLYLLASLSAIPRYTQYIKDHTCHALMDQYRLVQLNLHDGAYQVLRNISGKQYALDDVVAWEAWEQKNCPKPDKV